jgi:RNA polymerase sigma-70 factor (ECF subfamily)
MVGRRNPEETGSAVIIVDEHVVAEHDSVVAPVLVSISIADVASVLQLSDTDLLRLHVAGDPDAFGELFLRHKDRLWAVALRTAADPEDAADALQEAMVSAFRRAGDFRGDSAVTTWLHRIVVNAAVDRLRRRPVQALSWSGEPADLDALAVHATADSSGRSAVVAVTIDPMDSTEVRLDVDAALRRLPDQQRIALVLVDMLGYPVAEVAEILGVSIGTVKSRCARGRVRLLPFLSHLRTNFADVGNQQRVTGVSLGRGRRRMSRRLGHPSPEALACFRAGMVREGRGRRLSAHASRCPRCAVLCTRLDAVVAALATAPVPVLPSATERRVISVIHAESGARASAAQLSGIGVDSTPARRPVAAAVAAAVPLAAAPYRPARLRVRSWVARVGVTGSLVAVIASLGYLVRGAGTGSSAQASSSSSAGLAPGRDPHAAHSPAPAEVTAPESLIGCVLHLTGNVLPEFVNRATYQARPAYVFADANGMWVAGIDCTATRPALITAMRLSNGS